MQFDETDILIYIVYNSWTTEKVYNAAERRSEARSAVFQVKTWFYMPDLFIQLFIFYTVWLFTVLMVNRYDMHSKS